MGSFFLFGADALEWTLHVLARVGQQQQQQRRVVSGHVSRSRHCCRLSGIPDELEIVTKLLVNLLDTQPDNAQVLYWTQQLNLCQISNANTAKGCVMAQMNNAILSDSSALAARARNRIAASQMIKYETDTATEQGSTTDRNVVLNAPAPVCSPSPMRSPRAMRRLPHCPACAG